MAQAFQEISEREHADLFMAGERKKMAVTGDDDVGLSEEGTFENPIIRLIRENMKVRLGLQDRSRPTDRREELLGLLIRPVEFSSEDVGGSGENEEGSEEIESSSHGMQIGLFRIAARNGKGRDEDIRIEDDPHVQRPRRTRVSTSASVRIPFFLACRTPYR